MALCFEMTFRARVFYCLQTAGSPFFTILRSIFLSVSTTEQRDSRQKESKGKGSKGLSCHDLQFDERPGQAGPGKLVSAEQRKFRAI